MFIIDYVFDKLGYVRKPVPVTTPWPFPPAKIKPTAKRVVKKTVVKKSK
jgi:hypothetical protein